MASRVLGAAGRHPIWTTLIVLVVIWLALMLALVLAAETHHVSGYTPR